MIYPFLLNGFNLVLGINTEANVPNWIFYTLQTKKLSLVFNEIFPCDIEFFNDILVLTTLILSLQT